MMAKAEDEVADLRRQLEEATDDARALSRMLDETLAELADVLEIAIARGESLGYIEADENERGRLQALRSLQADGKLPPARR